MNMFIFWCIVAAFLSVLFVLFVVIWFPMWLANYLDNPSTLKWEQEPDSSPEYEKLWLTMNKARRDFVIKEGSIPNTIFLGKAQHLIFKNRRLHAGSVRQMPMPEYVFRLKIVWTNELTQVMVAKC